MDSQDNINYNRIEQAITFIQDHWKDQPDLATIAAHVHVSPTHFQKLFTTWAGVSPKKFMQYLSLNYTKSLLAEKQVTLFDATHEAGLSSTSRLHDLFISIEGMTPKEFKHGGKGITIDYSFSATPFGLAIVASTDKGICLLAFCKDEADGLADLARRFPHGHYTHQQKDIHHKALQIFTMNWADLDQVKLHLHGTPFQLKVWEALLHIPLGEASTYGSIAQQINQPTAARAVGTAIGSNPIAFIIPCHRVIQTSGKLGGYMWGPQRKAALLGWEAAQINQS